MFNFNALIHFWLYHPALLYGFSFYLGTCAHLSFLFFVFLPLLIIWIPFSLCVSFPLRERLKPLFLSGLIFFTAWGYTAFFYPHIELSKDGTLCQAEIQIKNLQFKQTLFGKKWIYACVASIHSPLISSVCLPCTICLSKEHVLKYGRPLANCDYKVEGKIIQSDQRKYFLKISSQSQWIPKPSFWAFAEKRYELKNKVSQWIHHVFPHSSSAQFLAGLATGEFDDYTLKEEFARFGLQHILAISGFHFAIVAMFMNIFLRLFLPYFWANLFLLCLLAAYALFLGTHASVLRAWMMCSFSLAGALLHKQTSSLNTLGLAALIILVYDPLLGQDLAFQLSFSITLAILLFFPITHNYLKNIIPERSLKNVSAMNMWNQHAYCVISYLRQLFALTLAVNIFAFPMTLYYFQQFPVMSLIYNLFFPLLVTGSVGLLLIGISLSFVPLVGSTLNTFNSFYTDAILQLTYHIPKEVDTVIVSDFLTPSLIISYLCITFLLSVAWQNKQKTTRETDPLQFL